MHVPRIILKTEVAGLVVLLFTVGTLSVGVDQHDIVTINSAVPRAPVIVKSIPDGGYKAYGGEDVIFFCQVEAVPAVFDIIWTDNRGLMIKEGVETNNTWTSLKFRAPSNFSSDEEKFTCQFTNSEGMARKTLKVAIKKDVGIYVAFGISVAIILILFSLLLRYIYLAKKGKKLLRDLLGTLLENGDPQRIKPETQLKNQVDLLPYDPKWEYPRDKLIFGEQLERLGHFGIVIVRAALASVSRHQEDNYRQVFVKMIKSTKKDQFAIASLVYELKILMYLGPHLNVVNLLGACTKGELLVIEEFCQYGNLRNYLIDNRDAYVNELNETTIAGESQNETNRVVSLENHESLLEPDNKYGGNKFRNFGERVRIRTRDLICWSFQIANGMNHLARKKVIHGELAARNIFLAEGNVVKIANFETSFVTKDMNATNKEKRNVPLSVEWMAIESLMDGVFTTQSDVWSFGVLLWELFSLGKTPYADTEFKDLFQFL